MIGERLRNLRKNRKLTLKKVESLTQISNAHLSQIETGRIVSPGDDILKKLANVYNVSLESLKEDSSFPDDSKPNFDMSRLIGSTDLDDYANTIEAASVLPELVQDLILATCEVEALAMPCGDSVTKSGWDGKVSKTESPIHPFVPEGESFWELGKGSSPTTKANADFVKRTEDTPLSVRQKSVFVFVTLRRWSTKDTWLNEKLKESKWLDVKAYDADDLETWLSIAPAVALRYARKLNLFPNSDAISLIEFWDNWWLSTDPPINHEFLLEVAPPQINNVSRFLTDTNLKSLVIHSPDQEAAIAYLCSVIKFIEEKDPNLSKTIWSKAIVCYSKEAFNRLQHFKHNLILVSAFDNPPVNQATSRGHKVYVPALSSCVPSNQEKSISRVPSQVVSEFLFTESPDLSQAEAERQSKKIGGSLANLIWFLKQNQNQGYFEWAAKPEVASQLAFIALVGSWDNARESDVSFLTDLLGKNYTEVESFVLSQTNNIRPACKRTGSIFSANTHLLVYSQLKDYLSADLVDRFIALSVEQLKYLDPKLDIPKDERHLFISREITISYEMRKGLCIGLALLATSPPTHSPEVQATINYKLKTLFDSFSTWKNWASLGELTQILIEAVPDVILDSLNQLINSKQNEISKLFEKPSFYSSPDYTNLLWSLEKCAWSPSYLKRVTDILLKLIPFEDSTSNWVNKPSNTLFSIYSIWLPQTSVSIEDRLELIRGIISKDSSLGWDLLAHLLPGRRAMGTENCKPVFQSWADNWSGYPNNAQINSGINLIFQELKNLLLGDQTFLNRVMTLFTDLPSQPHQYNLLKIVDSFDVAEIPSNTRQLFWENLESVYFRHASFRDAPWSAKGKLFKLMGDLYNKFSPADPVLKWHRIFASHVQHPLCLSDKGTTWQERESLLVHLRLQAIAKILKPDSEMLFELNRLLSFETVDPYCIGLVLAEYEEQSPLDFNVVDEFSSNYLENKIKQLLNGYFWRKSQLIGINEAYNLCTKVNQHKFQAFVLAAFRFNKKTWTLVESLDNEIEPLYWRFVRFHSSTPDECETIESVEKYLKYGRPLAAFDALCRLSDPKDLTKLPTPLAEQVLTDLLQLSPDDPDLPDVSGLFSYQLHELLTSLSAKPDINKALLASVEWNYLETYDLDKEPKNLVNEINNNPSFFIEIVDFLTENKGDTEPTPQEINQAKKAFTLLRRIRSVPSCDSKGHLSLVDLKSWVDRVREMARKKTEDKPKFLDLVDSLIGEFFSFSTDDPKDGLWPHMACRDILESVGSPSMEYGFFVGILNLRGVVSKAMFEGGAQEYALAKKYMELSQKHQMKWCRCSKVLRDVHASYKLDAQREDIKAERDRSKYSTV